MRKNSNLKNKNQILFNSAKKYIPGGVNSPVRAFKAVGGNPLFIERGRDSKIIDVEGKEYIDYVCAWGSLILGHSNNKIIKEVKNVLFYGTSYGAPTEKETKIAKKIIQNFPSIELLRLVSSGTEATMSVLRVARGYTNKNKIIKFAGCYHGSVDYLLVSAGSGATTLNIPDSLGVPGNVVKDTIILPFNDLEIVTKTIKQNYKKISSIIIEPVPGNMGVVLPKDGFLEGMRDLCSKHRIVLIFDEVITGFRVSKGGVQELFGIKPDLTCLGKIIGGGFPIGAYGGKKEIMKCVAPLGKVYQAGTLSGNPIGVTAGLKTLEIISTQDTYKTLEERTKFLCDGIKENAKRFSIKITINRIGSMFTIFFTDKEVIDYESAKTSDIKKYSIFFHQMLKNGIYLPPSQFEGNFVSLAHTNKDIEKTISASYSAFKKI